MSLVQLSCGMCGIEFAIPGQFMESRRRSGRTFFCPNGDEIAWKVEEHPKFREIESSLADARDEIARLHSVIDQAEMQISAPDSEADR